MAGQSARRAAGHDVLITEAYDHELVDVLTGEAGQHHDVEQAIDLRLALGRLRPPDRVILWLAYVERLGSEQIGAVLGIRREAARQRLARAAKRLRAELGSHYPRADHGDSTEVTR